MSDSLHTQVHIWYKYLSLKALEAYKFKLQGESFITALASQDEGDIA